MSPRARRFLYLGLLVLALANVALVILARRHAASPAPPALIGAAREGDIQTVRKLIESDPGAVDTRDAGGFTPLHAAVDEFQYDEVVFLVDHKADLAARAANGITPLLAAVQKGHTRIAAFLLEHGARVDVVDDDGWTALHWAVYLCKEDMADLLMRHGASAATRDREGHTPLDLAEQLGPPGLVARLGGPAPAPAATPDVFELARKGRYGQMDRIISQSYGMAKQRDRFGWTATLWLIRKGRSGGTKYEAWRDAGPQGITGLHMVVQLGDPYWLSRVLEDKDVLIDAADAQGRTPLHWAILLRDAGAAQSLVAAGADINLRDAKGRTPLALARTYGLEAVAAMLAARGGEE